MMTWFLAILERLKRWPSRPHPAVRRARSMTGYELGGRPIRYDLGSGGVDPEAPTPAQERDGRLWCDCSGLTAWSLGIPRKHPDFPRYSGWINTNSMIASAKAGDGWFQIVEDPQPGDLIVFGGKPGHVGLVAEVGPGYEPGLYRHLSVVHCSAGNDRNLGHSIAETSGALWEGRESVVLRFVGPPEG